jgi:TorA maturation chaperone TorD
MTDMTAASASNEAVAQWLETAACWRFAAILFARPADEGDELARLHAELPSALRDASVALLRAAACGLEDEYHRVLGPAGIPAAESAYDQNALAGRGPVLADVAGFYRAFSYSPPLAAREVADHVSVELDFLAFLAMKMAFASWNHADEDADVTRAAYREFAEYHLMFWMPPFLEKLHTSGSTVYGAAADWLQAWLASANLSQTVTPV